MIADCRTDTVYVSDLLEGRHPQIFSEFKKIFAGRLRAIPGTKDIWARDYMPVQIDLGRFVQFRFDPGYLKPKKYRDRRTPNGSALLDLPGCAQSDLVIDGGNIVHWRNTAITTDKIYAENRRVPRATLRERLRAALGVERLIIIPKEPDDIFGHADGMVRFINADTVLVNDTKHCDHYKKVAAVLQRQGLRSIPFPYAPTDDVGDDETPSAKGVYIIFLQTADIILLPRFGLPEDEEAEAILRRYFSQCRITRVQCDKLAANGGLLNCVSWTIREAARAAPRYLDIGRPALRRRN